MIKFNSNKIIKNVSCDHQLLFVLSENQLKQFYLNTKNILLINKPYFISGQYNKYLI